MIVVSDASPIISLSSVGRLDLLTQLYEQIIVPASVLEEIAISDPDRPGVREVRHAEWLSSEIPQNRVLVRALEGELDRGEAEAIALAIEVSADFLIVDERRGREVARRMGVRVIGVLGILIEAKSRGFIPAVAPILEALLTEAGFRISPNLYRRVLEASDEAPSR